MGSNLPARTCAKELRIADRLQHGEGWTDADHLSAKPAEPAPNNRDVGFQFISASAGRVPSDLKVDCLSEWAEHWAKNC